MILYVPQSPCVPVLFSFVISLSFHYFCDCDPTILIQVLLHYKWACVATSYQIILFLLTLLLWFHPSYHNILVFIKPFVSFPVWKSILIGSLLPKGYTIFLLQKGHLPYHTTHQQSKLIYYLLSFVIWRPLYLWSHHPTFPGSCLPLNHIHTNSVCTVYNILLKHFLFY